MRSQFCAKAAVYQADVEQIPNSCRDWYSVQHGIGITDGEDSVLWAAREAPLVQLSDFHTGQWRTELGPMRGHLYSWLMNNLYFTNFKAAQSGRMQFSYRFTTQKGDLNRSDVRTFGEAFGNPPLARVAWVEPGSYEWLRVKPETVQVQLLTSATDRTDAFVLRLKETSGQPTLARIVWKQPDDVRFLRMELLELEVGETLRRKGDAFVIEMGAHELATVQGVFNNRHDDSQVL